MGHHPPSSKSIAENLRRVRQRIDDACRLAGRSPGEVRLLLASKTVSVSRIHEAIAEGVTLLGENRVQELAAKAPKLQDAGVEWHMIGHLQTNKVRQVLDHAQVIQTVDRPSLVKALQRELEKRDASIDVFMQVNTSGETSKFGVSPEEAESFAKVIASSPNLRLRGLMTIALHTPDPEGARPCFRLLRELRDRLETQGLGPLPHLSMGMSGDLEVAIEEGSTLVRVGTAAFGERSPA